MNAENIEFSIQDAYDLKYRQGSMDVVLVVNALHVMLYPEKVLKQIYRVLKPGGIFISATYCHGNSIKSRLVSGLMSLSGFKAYRKWSTNEYMYFLENKRFVIKQYEILKDSIPLAFAVSVKV